MFYVWRNVRRQKLMCAWSWDMEETSAKICKIWKIKSVITDEIVGLKVHFFSVSHSMSAIQLKRNKLVIYLLVVNNT